MSRVLPRRLVVLLTASLALVLMALVFSAPSASATGFCGGARVNNINKCFGAARVFTIVQGHGNETSVCVGYNEFVGPCSGGPNQNVEWNLGSAANRSPSIIGHASAFTIAFGETF
jgi:hypothetical protein